MHSYFGVGSLGLRGLLSLQWFTRRYRVSKMTLPELLPTVRLAATAISGVNASALCGLSSIIWFIIPDRSGISECKYVAYRYSA